MSLNVLPLETINQVDQRVRIQNVRKYGVLQGAQQVTYKNFPSSNLSLSAFEITCNPPSRETIINAKVWLRAKVRLTFVGTVTAPNTHLLDIGHYDAPRAYPLAQCISSMQATIQNDTFSTNLNQYISALLRYKNDVEQRGYDYSNTPSMLDQYSEYANGLTSNRNPLGVYNDTSEREMARGGFYGLNVISNNNVGAVVEVEVTEPVFMSPFYFGMGEQSGFVGIETMSLTGVFSSLTRFWSHGANPMANITSVTPEILSLSSLFLYLTPKIIEPIPKLITYPYYEITSYPTTVGSVAANTTTEATFNSIQLKCIPECIYVFLRRRNADLFDPALGYTRTDTFAEIQNVNVTFNNISGLLATQQPEDLYQMCVANGLDLSYEQFRGSAIATAGSGLTADNKVVGTVGSVVKIQFAKDIGVASDLSCGVLGTYQLSLTVRFRNISRSEAVNFDGFIIVQNPGSMSVIDGSVMHQVGVLSRQDVLDTAQKPEMLYVSPRDGPLYGSGFWDSLKNFFSSAKDKVKSVVDMIPADIRQRALDYGKSQVAKQLGGRAKKRRGGKLISRSDLRDKLNMYEE